VKGMTKLEFRFLLGSFCGIGVVFTLPLSAVLGQFLERLGASSYVPLMMVIFIIGCGVYLVWYIFIFIKYVQALVKGLKEE
jgi:hypothetical protein